MNNKSANIDEYITGFPVEVQKVLEQVRETIKKAAPEAEELISYSIPAFKLNGNYLVYFAAFPKHIGFYPAPVGMEKFKKDFAKYKTGKGSVQFPLNAPMPLGLITKIVKFRVQGTLKKEDNFFPSLSAPARRALKNNGINTLAQLAKYSEKEILDFHGIGKTAIPLLKNALQQKGLSFKKN